MQLILYHIFTIAASTFSSLFSFQGLTCGDFCCKSSGHFRFRECHHVATVGDRTRQYWMLASHPSHENSEAEAPLVRLSHAKKSACWPVLFWKVTCISGTGHLHQQRPPYTLLFLKSKMQTALLLPFGPRQRGERRYVFPVLRLQVHRAQVGKQPREQSLSPASSQSPRDARARPSQRAHFYQLCMHMTAGSQGTLQGC